MKGQASFGSIGRLLKLYSLCPLGSSRIIVLQEKSKGLVFIPQTVYWRGSLLVKKTLSSSGPLALADPVSVLSSWCSLAALPSGCTVSSPSFPKQFSGPVWVCVRLGHAVGPPLSSSRSVGRASAVSLSSPPGALSRPCPGLSCWSALSALYHRLVRVSFSVRL